MIDFDEIEVKIFDYKIIIVIIAAIIIAFYIAELMFGVRSFSKMIDLQNSVKVLEKRVTYLKKENEKLQKEYFELKELEGE
jgi:cell division protein FtsB